MIKTQHLHITSTIFPLIHYFNKYCSWGRHFFAIYFISKKTAFFVPNFSLLLCFPLEKAAEFNCGVKPYWILIRNLSWITPTGIASCHAHCCPCPLGLWMDQIHYSINCLLLHFWVRKFSISVSYCISEVSIRSENHSHENGSQQGQPKEKGETETYLWECKLLVEVLCYHQKPLWIPVMSVDNDTALERWQTGLSEHSWHHQKREKNQSTLY